MLVMITGSARACLKKQSYLKNESWKPSKVAQKVMNLIIKMTKMYLALALEGEGGAGGLVDIHVAGLVTFLKKY